MPASLPTLLTSKPQLPEERESKDLARGRGEARHPTELPEAYSMAICVRNTFIDTSTERSPSLERFYKEREVSTCPSAHIGRLRDLFKLADVESADDDADRGTQPPDEILELCTDSEASGSEGPPAAAAAAANASAAAAGGGPVISLAEALHRPVAPPPASAPAAQACGVGGPAACGSGYVICVAYPAGVLCGGTAAAAAAPGCSPEVSARAAGRVVELATASLRSTGSARAPPQPPASAMAEAPRPGDAAPSIGSAGHGTGQCKPCAFFHTRGCANNAACEFCHLCEPGEKQRRRKEKVQAQRERKELRKASRQEPAVRGDDQRVAAPPRG